MWCYSRFLILASCGVQSTKVTIKAISLRLKRPIIPVVYHKPLVPLSTHILEDQAGILGDQAGIRGDQAGILGDQAGILGIPPVGSHPGDL